MTCLVTANSVISTQDQTLDRVKFSHCRNVTYGRSLIAEKLELVRAGEQPEEVLRGEPDHAEGLHQVDEAVLHQRPVIQRLLGTEFYYFKLRIWNNET